MTAVPENRDRAAYWSWAGFAEGARLVMPVMPGMIMFGAAFGALAAQKGLSLLEATLMSGLVYAGASQFVALEMWPEIATLGGIAAIGLVTAAINMRFILMTASLRPWFGTLPAWQSYPALFTVTDPGWLIAMNYHAKGGRDAAIIVGGGLAFWLSVGRFDGAGLSARRAGDRPEDVRLRRDHARLLRGDAGAAVARSTPRDPLGSRGRRGLAGGGAHSRLVVHYGRLGRRRHRRGIHR